MPNSEADRARVLEIESTARLVTVWGRADEVCLSLQYFQWLIDTVKGCLKEGGHDSRTLLSSCTLWSTKRDLQEEIKRLRAENEKLKKDQNHLLDALVEQVEEHAKHLSTRILMRKLDA